MSKITVVVPCFGRPERTKRVVQNILSQTITDWEAFFIGDNCPDFQHLIDSGYFADASKQSRENGNVLIASNLPNHYGGYGYEARNRAKSLANGEYICFVDNDDFIMKNHFENYYTAIKGTENDFMYFDSFIEPLNKTRTSSVKFGEIGHAELVIKTEFYKRMPPQTPEYGHDWKLIENMVEAGAKFEKAVGKLPTYVVMGLGELREYGID
jgi:glycosyltransferase involved in cell wall biosynthesis